MPEKSCPNADKKDAAHALLEGFQFLGIPGTDGIHLICRKHASFEEVHSAKILEAVGMKIGIIDFQPAFRYPGYRP